MTCSWLPWTEVFSGTVFSPSLVYLEQLPQASYAAGGQCWLFADCWDMCHLASFFLAQPLVLSVSAVSLSVEATQLILPAAHPADPNHLCSSVGGAEEAAPVATLCVAQAVRQLAAKTNAMH